MLGRSRRHTQPTDSSPQGPAHRPGRVSRRPAAIAGERAPAAPAPSSSYLDGLHGQKKATLRDGSFGADVVALQQDLIRAGVNTGGADGVFGPKTAAAVRAFQKAHGLKPDGIYGPQTLSALSTQNKVLGTPINGGTGVNTEVEVLHKGASGEAVSSMQAQLSAAGFDLGKADGEFGPKTRRALIAFQKKHGLTADGVWGPKTAAAMGGLSAKDTKTEVVPPTPSPAEPTRPGKTGGAAREPSGPDEVKAATERDEAVAQNPKKTTPELDKLIGSDWGEGKGRVQKLQKVLQSLGYLPKGQKLDGKMGSNTTNALMAFQVNMAGVNKVELGRDSKGRPIYANDRSKNRFEGKVDGDLGPATRAGLEKAMVAERQRLQSGEKEPTSVREMGDNPQQRKAIAKRLRKLGVDPGKVMSIDTAQFRKLGLRPHVLDAAIDGWENQFAKGKIKGTVITVNDFELPNNMRRSFTIDLAHPEKGVQMHEVLAHGYGTAGGRAGSEAGRWSKKFGRSNTKGSGQSVLGGMRVGRESAGSKQYGIRAEGLERGINNNADDRLIRMHAKHGQVNDGQVGHKMYYRSAGCLVLPDAAAKEYKRDAKKEGGRYNFDFAPHERYWGRKNDVNRD